MSKSMSVVLAEYFDAFIERQVRQGRYRSPTDVIEAGLRLLDEKETKLEALRTALIEGEQSGLSTPFDLQEFLEEMRRERTAQR
ncbi:MAG: type II toxin-antitoxin system ParD family antitoxin [Xanthobacteraceae bacterium]|nr:type II toxin-antitoxin system ParD family antitoxin [Xanthobacteraceae bacterium]